MPVNVNAGLLRFDPTPQPNAIGDAFTEIASAIMQRKKEQREEERFNREMEMRERQQRFNEQSRIADLKFRQRKESRDLAKEEQSEMERLADKELNIKRQSIQDQMAVDKFGMEQDRFGAQMKEYEDLARGREIKRLNELMPTVLEMDDPDLLSSNLSALTGSTVSSDEAVRFKQNMLAKGQRISPEKRISLFTDLLKQNAKDELGNPNPNAFTDSMSQMTQYLLGDRLMSSIGTRGQGGGGVSLRDVAAGNVKPTGNVVDGATTDTAQDRLQAQIDPHSPEAFIDGVPVVPDGAGGLTVHPSYEKLQRGVETVKSLSVNDAKKVVSRVVRMLGVKDSERKNPVVKKLKEEVPVDKDLLKEVNEDITEGNAMVGLSKLIGAGASALWGEIMEQALNPAGSGAFRK